MRARNIKPSIFKNEVLGTADPLLTILFEGLWCEADREGRLEDRPMRIRAEVFPYREGIDIESQLSWLHEHGFIQRFIAKGLKIIQILKFSEHQKPHTKETASILPTLDDIASTKTRAKHDLGKGKQRPRNDLGNGEHALTPDSGLLTPSSLTPDSGLLTADCLLLPSEAMSGKKPDDVQIVFDHWRLIWNHLKAHLDIKRRALIQRALKGYSAADLCESISGYMNSPFHTGQNDSQTVYSDLELFLRDSGKIDKGLAFARDPPELTSKLQQHNVAVLKAWVPPELRNENAGFSEISGSDGEPERDIRQRTLPPNH